MKRLVILFAAGLFLFACSDTVDPRYDSRNRMIGYYDAKEYSSTYRDFTYYTIQVVKGSAYDEIYIRDLYADGLQVYAVVSNSSLTIPFQVIDGYQIDGTGCYDGQLHLDYRVKDRYNNTAVDYCQTIAR